MSQEPPITPLNRKLARNAFFLLTSQVALSALSLILTAVLGRWLGVMEFGVYYLLASLSALVYVFVDWGQSAYLTRESACRRTDCGQLLGGALVYRIAVALMAALVTAALVKVVGYDGRTEFLIVLAVVCGLPLALSQAYGYVFRGRDRMDLDAAVNITGKALTVAVTVPALYLGGGLLTVVLLQVAGGVGALVLATFMSASIRVRAQRPERGILRELASNGTPIAVVFVAMAVQPFIDAVVLAKLAPVEVVGWYGAARTIMGVLIAPAPIVGTAVLPELSRVSASVKDLRLALHGTSRLMVGLGVLAAIGTLQFADAAVGLVYGRGDFDPAIAVLKTFAPVLPLLFIDILFANAIIAVGGNTKKIAIVKALSVAVATGLSVVLIPLCQSRLNNGGIGLVLAFGLTEIMMLTGLLCLLPRGTVGPYVLLAFLRAIVAGGSTMVIFWVLPSVTPWLAIPACVAVFLALAYATGLILRTDLARIVESIEGTFRGLGLDSRDRTKAGTCRLDRSPVATDVDLD